MYHTLIILFLILQYFIFVETQYLCIEWNLSNNDYVFYTTLSETIVIRQKSIVCEDINNSSFDLVSIFIKLSTILSSNNQSLLFNDFILHNTQINHLPKNLFGNITFSTIILYNNPLLNSIDIDTFNNTQKYIEVFKTLNTSLSDKLFIILKQFHNLKFISMENDTIQSIPDYTFNHTELRYIWLGIYSRASLQPIIHIEIVSPLLTNIGKYSLAMNRRSILMNDVLFIEISGEMLNASSFEMTSLTRFRSRPVFLRLYNTSIDYLDENIFQTFLETHPLSLLDIQDSNISQICDYRSIWIKNEYCTNIDWTENRVYGTACCSLSLN